jgi:hypothetical protein
MNWIKKHITVIFAITISCYGLYLRFMKLGHRELWKDEVYQFHCMQGAFKPFWLHQNYGDHSTFPGEYLLNYFFVQGFGMNKWGLAIPHIFITIIGFWLLYKVGHFYFRSWVGYFIAFVIMAFNQLLVFHSFEFRPYAVLPVLALASLYCAHRINDKACSWSKRDTFLTGLLVVIVVNYHAYGLTICFLPLMFVALVHWKRNSLSRPKESFFNNKMSRADLLVLSFFTLIALLLWGWYAAYNNWGLAPNLKAQSVRETFEVISNPAVKPYAFFKTIMISLVANKWRSFFLFSIVLSLLLPVGKKFEQFVFAGILIILPISLILYADLRSHYWFLDRQFVWVMPFASIFLGWQWDNIYCFAVKKICPIPPFSDI